MAIELVDFPIKDCDFPVRYVSLPEDKFPMQNQRHLEGTQVLEFYKMKHRPSATLQF